MSYFKHSQKIRVLKLSFNQSSHQPGYIITTGLRAIAAPAKKRDLMQLAMEIADEAEAARKKQAQSIKARKVRG